MYTNSAAQCDHISFPPDALKGTAQGYTLKILKELKIELGFKQIMTIEKEKGMKKLNNSFLEIARQDHAQIYKSMN